MCVERIMVIPCVPLMAGSDKSKDSLADGLIPGKEEVCGDFQTF